MDEHELINTDAALDPDYDVAIYMGVQDGQPSAEIMIAADDTTDDKIVSDFLALYLYLASGNVLNHLKDQVRMISKNTDRDFYKKFNERLNKEMEKNMIKMTKPFISPLDVFRRK